MRMLTHISLVALFAITSGGAVQANQQEERPGQKINPQDNLQAASDAHGQLQLPDQGAVVLRPTAGNKARGVLRLIQEEENLHIRGKVIGLSPGLHGFHIHEYGDMRSPDGTSAGGHFNPYGKKHGPPGADTHVGDLGNIRAGEDGVAEVSMVVQNIPLHFILGRAFVVHGGEDDLQSQPSGDAGPRVAVGIVGVANPDIKQLLPQQEEEN